MKLSYNFVMQLVRKLQYFVYVVAHSPLSLLLSGHLVRDCCHMYTL